MIKQKYRWKFNETINSLNREINDTTSNSVNNTSININPIIIELLKSRNIDDEEQINRFLYDGIDKLYNPMLLKDMDKAVDRIIKARNEKEKITIYGDYDVDGITSTAVLYTFLKRIGCDVNYYIPSRLVEGYGMNKNAINKIAQDETMLIVTVDTGITAIQEAKLIEELGMDLVITDHHEPQGEIPKAIAVVNPKRDDNEYPFRDLAGVGVSYKLVKAIEQRLLEKNEIIKSNTQNDYLEFVTLGTIADVVSMLDENRIIIREGLKQLVNTKNVGIKALFELTKLSEKKKLDAKDIGFSIAPKLNAAGRLGDAKLALELLLEEDEKRAKDIAVDLMSKNIERQSCEQSIYSEALEIIEQDESLKESKIIVVKGTGWNHGVIGIVASRIVSKYYKPVIILNEESGNISGSARSIEDVNIFKIIEEAKEFLTRFGGHEGAAGLSLSSEKYDEFKGKVIEVANEVIDEEVLVPSCYIDMQLNADDISEELIENLEILEPFGPGNEKPIFKIKGLVSNANIIGKNGEHLKIKLKGKDVTIDGVFFYGADVYDSIIVDQEYEIVGELQINEFNNNRSLQCMMEDMRNDNRYISNIKYYISKFKQIRKEIEKYLELESERNVESKEEFNFNIQLEYDEKVNDIYELVNMIEQKEINEKNIIILVDKNKNFNILLDKIENYEYENLSIEKIKVIYNQINKKKNYDESIDKNDITILVNSIENTVDLRKNYNIIYYDELFDESDDILISKDDVAQVYRRIKFIDKIGKNSIDLEEMQYNLKEKNLYQILISLSILQELNILDINLNNLEQIEFKINKNEKNNIENSKIYNTVKR